MNISNDIYRGFFYPCYLTPEGRRESTEELIFMAETPMEACEDFCVYAIHQFKLRNEHFQDKWTHIGCIKLSRFYPYLIGDKGVCSHVAPVPAAMAALIPFAGMEWKCDGGLYTPSAPSRGLVKLLEEVRSLRGGG